LSEDTQNGLRSAMARRRHLTRPILQN